MIQRKLGFILLATNFYLGMKPIIGIKQAVHYRYQLPSALTDGLQQRIQNKGFKAKNLQQRIHSKEFRLKDSQQADQRK